MILTLWPSEFVLVRWHLKLASSSSGFLKSNVQAGKLALANASENLVGRVENRTGRVEFCIGYIRDYPVRASAKNF